MIRHNQGLSQVETLKRGFISILAFIFCMGVYIKPVKAYVPQGSLQISYVNFFSMRNINPNTGTDLTNNEDWIILDFNFDGYFSGSVDMTLTFTKPVLSDPEHTAIGANAYRLSSTTTGNTSFVQQTDRWLFKFENTQHFQFIYHLSSTGGISFSGNFGTITVDVTHSEDGSSVPSVSIDYTNILQDILDAQTDTYMSIDEINQYIESINNSNSNIATTLGLIKTAVDTNVRNISQFITDYKNMAIYDNLKWYQIDAFQLFRGSGYTINRSSNIPFFTWNQKKPSMLTPTPSQTIVRISKGVETYVVYYSNAWANESLTLSYNNNDLVTVQTRQGDNRYLKYGSFTYSGTSSYAWLSNVTGQHTYVYPIYYGSYDSMPEDVKMLIGKKSNNTLLENIVALFTQNNQQNDEVLQSLEGINQKQQTINQNIENFNSDFNTALNDVPISETLNQLQNLNSAFTEVNNWWLLLWEKLGLFKLVIVVALVLMLIRIFTGREK